MSINITLLFILFIAMLVGFSIIKKVTFLLVVAAVLTVAYFTGILTDMWGFILPNVMSLLEHLIPDRYSIELASVFYFLC